ncbi:MAG: hypothetical protein H7Y31_02605 [Chitinophagaceae bacterium]|nr:hypothetical protein [Chitinophagaceae bacterium]
MKKRAHQILTACFLLVILGIPGLLFMFFQVRQWQIREEMEEKLEKMHVVSLKVSTKNVVWYKRGKEIIVDGRLFDVKTMETMNDVVSFTGIFDDKETLVKAQMEKLKSPGSGKNQNADLVAKYLSLVLYPHYNRSFSLSIILSIRATYRSHDGYNLLTTELSAPDRPPNYN